MVRVPMPDGVKRPNLTHGAGANACMNSTLNMLQIRQNHHFEMVWFPAFLRILEYNPESMLVYICRFVESDGRCQPGRAEAKVFSRSTDDVPDDVLTHYADLVAEVCLQIPDEFVKIEIQGRYCQPCHLSDSSTVLQP